MNKLSRIEIQGYKSLRHIDLRDLGPLNVMIGANGAGKSNFLSFFSLLNWMSTGAFQQFVLIHGSANSLLTNGAKATPQITATLAFDTDDGTNTYHQRLAHAAPDTLIFVDEAVSFQRRNYTIPPLQVSLGAGHKETLVRSDHPNQTVRFISAVLLRCRAYQFHDTSRLARVRLTGKVSDNRRLLSDAGNLAAYLYALRQTKNGHYRRIVDTVAQVYPAFADFDLEPARLDPESISLQWRERGSDYLFGPHQLSDGTLRAIALITLLLQPDDDLPDILLIDEPELGLHPFALGVFASLAKAVATRRQVIVATQSPALVALFEAEDILVVERGPQGSDFRRLDPLKLKEWVDDFRLSELWEKNVLGGRPR